MAIISKEVDIRWEPITKAHYIKKGYSFTKYYDFFTVKVEDLHEGCQAEIQVTCDYCGTELMRKNKFIVNSIKKSIVGKYSCKGCSTTHKKLDELNKKQELGLLTKDDRGYWNFEENRKKELQIYIEENGSVDNLKRLYPTLYNSFGNHGTVRGGKTLVETVETLGYKWEDVSSIMKPYHFQDFNNVKESVRGFIEIHDRFPTTVEMQKELFIQSVDIRFHGGIDAIKRKMNYKDDNDLIDTRGFLNKSSFEYIVAQFLIGMDIPYKRETSPFPNKRQRADFEINTKTGDCYFIEVWGYRKTDDSKIGKRYNKIRKMKEKLYTELDLSLVSINIEDFESRSYAQMQTMLKDKLSFLKELSLKEPLDHNFVSPFLQTDQEILDTIMTYSKDKNVLPTREILSKAGLYSYTIEIRKRHGSYFNFAKSFNKTLSTQSNEWTKETIYRVFEDVVGLGRPINKHTIKEFDSAGMYHALKKVFGKGGYTTAKIQFYYEFYNGKIHPEDIKTLLIIAKREKSSSRYSINDIDKAREIVKQRELTSQMIA